MESHHTYLHEHRGGAQFAIELMKTVKEKHPGNRAGQLAAELLGEVEKDSDTLQQIIDRMGDGFLDLKQIAAWPAEKLSQLKIQSDDPGDLGTFEAFEILSLGILGKLALWHALQVVAETDPRVRGFDFSHLRERAESQHAKAEKFRLELARTALRRREK